MTEIRTEKQKPVWPWVLALIAFGVIIYLFFFRGDGNMNAEKKADPPGNDVSAYFQLVDDDTDTVGLSAEYTNEAIIRLTEATRAAAKQHDVDVSADLRSAESYTGNFTQESFDSSRADTVRVVAGDLATALIKIQEAKYPDLLKEANSLKAATVAIRADTLISEQPMEIKNFFRLAKDLLQKMYGQSP